MMQVDPSIIWSLWHFLGFFLSLPVVLYWVFLKKKLIGNEKIEGNIIPLDLVRRYLAVIAIPLTVAGVFDLIGNIVTYPALLGQIWIRSLTYFGGMFVALVWMYVVFIMVNWFKKDPWDRPTDSSSNEKESYERSQ